MGGLCLDPVDCKTEEVDTDGLPCFFVKNFVAELGTCTGKVSFSIIFEDRNNSQSSVFAANRCAKSKSMFEDGRQ
jgi:hypothetical protein